MNTAIASPIQIVQAATDRLMTEAEVESYIGFRPGVISRMRARGDRNLPPFIRVSTRSIRYRKSDLESYLNARRVIPQETR